MDNSRFLTLKEYDSKVEFDVPMCEYTSFKIGGPAKCMVTPRNEKALSAALKLADDTDTKVFILGGGSNILVSDNGFDGMIINMTEMAEELVISGPEEISVSTGIRMSRVSSFAMEEGLTGLEFASGIPGTLGGAIYMNAGAYGGEMKDIVTETRYIARNGDIGVCRGEEHGFGYRRSVFTDSDRIILSAKLKLSRGDRDKIASEMREIKNKRVAKQPLNYPSAGSTFKRPEGDFAGRLIEASGLKGCRIGGAMVSDKHAGFIVNVSDATARDVYDLILHVQDEVKRQQNVLLEREVKLIGEF